MKLRDYQQKAIDMLYSWFGAHSGNPCIVLPTGAGKSVVLAAFIDRALSEYPDTRILMCTHQKELIEQDYEKLVSIAPEIDTGIYSAGIGRRELGHSVTFASIQSIYRHMEEIGHVDIVLVDEAHLINHEAEGMYRALFSKLLEENPYLKVVGLTATPYRLKHGKITDYPAIFSEPLIEPVTIEELQGMGYLCRLRSKKTEAEFDLSKVGIVAGDYNQKQLEEAVDKSFTNEQVVDETIQRGQDRNSWLFFCSGVDHAQHICDLLISRGISAECVTGKTPKEEREKILKRFKRGEIRALTNANVLTTGFDHPGIDLIVMLRPTKSPGLYVQMAGRGLRISPDKKDCLVLDFAGNVMTHGPITKVRPPEKEGGKGPAPMKVCPECGEIIPMNSPACPVCFYEFPKKERDEKNSFFLHEETDINGGSSLHFIELANWFWTVKESRNGNRMLEVTYYPKNFNEKTFAEYILLDGVSDWRLQRNMVKINSYVHEATKGKKIFTDSTQSVTPGLVRVFNGWEAASNKPCGAVIHKSGKYYNVDYIAFGKTAKTSRWWNVEKNDWEVI